MTALGRVQRRYFDPVSGRPRSSASSTRATEEAIVTVRIRVEQKKITEAEWYLGRRGDDSMNGPPQRTDKEETCSTRQPRRECPVGDAVVTRCTRVARGD
jgi:hypothetical protein